MKAFGIGLVVWVMQTCALFASLMFLYFAYVAPTNGAPVWGFVMDVLLFVGFGYGWGVGIHASGKDILALSKRMEQEAEAEAMAARGMAE